MTEIVTGADGRTLSPRGEKTRTRILEAAEQVFAVHGFHDASIVKITEAAGIGQGTFYLYFASKKEIFDELVRDLNRRIRHAMAEQAQHGTTRIEQEILGFKGYLDFAAQHQGLYRIIRQSAFVSPEIFKWHYDRVSERYVAALQEAIDRRELGPIDPEVAAWALMALGETIGLRWIVWGDGDVPPHVVAELGRIVRAVLDPAQ
jgi:AcrR family transcriptional regulator